MTRRCMDQEELEEPLVPKPPCDVPEEDEPPLLLEWNDPEP